jgi:endonuclease G
LLAFFWRLGRRNPGLALFGLLAGGGWYAYEVLYVRPEMAFLGVPQAIDWTRPMTWTRVFRNHGFMVGYSELRGNPLWVVYSLSAAPANAPHLRRPPRFDADWRSLSRVGHDDYAGSGYDRGHMAPNHAVSLLYGRPAQLDTFLMTNVTPQKPDLNQRLWERLEEVELDRLAPLFGKVWVATGPLFDHDVERLRSSFRVEVPDAFYKIYAAPQPDGAPTLLAFIVPQSVKGNEPLNRFVASVDEVEARSGFDFFRSLDDGLENKLEASVDADAWRIREWSTLAGHYANGKNRATSKY